MDALISNRSERSGRQEGIFREYTCQGVYLLLFLCSIRLLMS